MDRKSHWEAVYNSKEVDGWSWYQDRPELSLALIEASGVKKSGALIDVGGGASTLADALLELGYSDLSVLDISESALERLKSRLKDRAELVTWFEGDITNFDCDRRFDLWHDRAVFHFLTKEADRQSYRKVLHKLLKPCGDLIVATFALDGPEKCSNLPTVRYTPQTLHEALGGAGQWELLESRLERHVTPKGGGQAFLYCRFRRSN